MNKVRQATDRTEPSSITELVETFGHKITELSAQIDAMQPSTRRDVVRALAALADDLHALGVRL